MEGSPFIEPGGEGPGFDPEAAAAGDQEVRSEQAAEARAAGELDAFGLPEVSEDQVRHGLFVAGDGLHAAVGVGDYDWLATERDLERIAPPLTRIINRYEAAKAIAGYSDELALATGMGLWAWRSLLERAAVLRQREELADRAPAPAPAPAPTYAPPPPRPVPEPAPWPEAVPAAPQASPPPVSSSPPAGGGGDHFPGAGAPREQPAAQVEIAPGYVTRAEQMRQARDRRPDAVPRQTPPAAQ